MYSTKKLFLFNHGENARTYFCHCMVTVWWVFSSAHFRLTDLKPNFTLENRYYQNCSIILALYYLSTRRSHWLLADTFYAMICPAYFFSFHWSPSLPMSPIYFTFCRVLILASICNCAFWLGLGPWPLICTFIWWIEKMKKSIKHFSNWRFYRFCPVWLSVSKCLTLSRYSAISIHMLFGMQVLVFSFKSSKMFSFIDQWKSYYARSVILLQACADWLSTDSRWPAKIALNIVTTFNFCLSYIIILQN